MIRSAASKVMWVGRATVFLVGLAVILALIFGVASTALGANGDFFKLGKKNVASAVSTLVKRGSGPALELQVGRGAPLAVNSSSKVAKLNADQLDGKDSKRFLTASTYKVSGNYTLGEPDPRTNGRHATLSCDEEDMLVNGSYYTGTVNNPNHYMGSNIITDDTWELEWWVPGGGSGGYVALVVTCLDTAAPAH